MRFKDITGIILKLRFIVYYREDEGQLCNINFSIISDCFKHDSVAVQSFIDVVLQYLTSQTCKILSKVYYFSDGAISQYKNYKNMCNLVYHQEDFKLEAEWHFFATSHGKNACDEIGGTVKREAGKASLKATTTGFILTPKQLFEWCIINITGIIFFYISKEAVEINASKLEKRYKNFRNSKLSLLHSQFWKKMRRISGDDNTDEVNSISLATCSSHLDKFTLGQFVVCSYDVDRWIGNIKELSFGNGDALVSFMSDSTFKHSLL